MKRSLSLTLAIFTLPLLILIFQACNQSDPAPEIQSPTIESFTPDSAPVGTTILITGTFFSTDVNKNVVSFNGTHATVTNATEKQLTVTVPANATTGKLTVSVNEGAEVESVNIFTVTTASVNQQPTTLTGFSPAIGLVGIEVIITGTNFSTTAASNLVTFNNVVASVKQATADGKSLTVIVPEAATTGKITVTVNGLKVTSSDDFTVTIPAENKWRVKQTNTDGFKTTEYIYDANNKLKQTKNYSQDQSDPNSVPVLNSTTDYFYNSDGTISSTKEGITNNTNNVYEVVDYQYADGKLQSYTFSKLVGAVKTLNFTNTFTYQNDVLSASSHIDVTYGTTSLSYTYSTDTNGNPQTIYHYPTFNSTYTFYSNAKSPDPVDIVSPAVVNEKLITKTMIHGLNANLNMNGTYSINADGNIESIHYDFPGMPTVSYTKSYVYETY